MFFLPRQEQKSTCNALKRTAGDRGTEIAAEQASMDPHVVHRSHTSGRGCLSAGKAGKPVTLQGDNAVCSCQRSVGNELKRSCLSRLLNEGKQRKFITNGKKKSESTSRFE
jgi:hypothetical protein